MLQNETGQKRSLWASSILRPFDLAILSKILQHLLSKQEGQARAMYRQPVKYNNIKG